MKQQHKRKGLQRGGGREKGQSWARDNIKPSRPLCRLATGSSNINHFCFLDTSNENVT